jgi:hypothetical protein
MAEVIPFVPKTSLDAAANMEEFIRLCREKLTVLGPDLDFDSASWDVTDHYERRGQHHRLVLNFVERSGAGRSLGPRMPEPFAMQAKAYVRYAAGLKAKRIPPQYTVIALRVLLEAFKDKGVEPNLCSLDTHMLDHAMHLAHRMKSGNFAAAIGVELALLSTFLRKRNLAPYAPLDWRHGAEWRHRSTMTNRATDERRKALLPSTDALRALPEAFRLAREPRDVIASSVVALLSCAPSRINEVLSLRSNCEIQPLTENEDGCLLRWAGSKGHPDFAKAIPAVMADVAAEAIARLKKHTSEARTIAAWYENNPNDLYLTEDCYDLRGRNLKIKDIARIIGFNEEYNAGDWVKQIKLEPVGSYLSSRSVTRYIYSFKDFQSAVLSNLPRGFPVIDRKSGLRFSEALMVCRRNEFALRRVARWRCMISPVTYSQIQHRFSDDTYGIFAQLGLSSADQPITLSSNQLRHYLNTIAQRGGLSEVEIAAWSGRQDIRQNAAYDHRTQEERLERKRRRDNELAAIAGKKASVNKPVSREDAAARSIHGHATELGFCEHDFASSPCVMFMECLHCTKQVCVKGADPRHGERVAHSLDSARRSLREAEEALSKEYEGAQEWVDAHRATVDRLEQLSAILADPGTPDGSIIRLAKSGQYSLVEQAMHDHHEASGTLLRWQSDMQSAIPGAAGDG